MAFIFQALAIAVLARIDAATKVIILWWWRWRPGRQLDRNRSVMDVARDSPIAICGDHIVDPKLLADLFNTQVKGVSLKLFASHVCHDGGGKTHEAGSFVFLRISPSISLTSPLGAICVKLCRRKVISTASRRQRWEDSTRLTSYWTAATLAAHVREARGRLRGSVTSIFSGSSTITATEPTAVAERDVVGASDALVSPGHDGR